MKALVWKGEKELGLEERQMPDDRGKVLIRVHYAGICGTDISVYLGKHPRAKAPLIIGHEFSGVIETVDGNTETELQPGMKVVVNPLYSCNKCRACMNGNPHVCRSLKLIGTDRDGGMAEYVAVPAENVYPIPEDMSLRLAAVIEPVAVVVHALRMVKNNFYTSACVTGLGPMGLLTALMLKDTGVKELFAVEANENRAEYGRKLGLTVINPLKEDMKEHILSRTDGEGVDLLVEASASPQVAAAMTDITAVRGEILLLSVFKAPAELDMRAVNFKEQTMIGTRVYTRLDFQDAVEYTYRNADKIEAVISHVHELERGPEVFKDLTSGGTEAMKVLFSCCQEEKQ